MLQYNQQKYSRKKKFLKIILQKPITTNRVKSNNIIIIKKNEERKKPTQTKQLIWIYVIFDCLPKLLSFCEICFDYNLFWNKRKK